MSSSKADACGQMKRLRDCVQFLLCGGTVLLVVGCGGGESDSSAPATTQDSAPAAAPTEESEAASASEASADAAVATADKPAEPAKTPVDPSVTGSFSGTIVLAGDAPELAPLIAEGQESAKDKEVCAAHAVPDQSLVVGEGNGIANVFVYLRRAPKGFKDEVPSEPVVLDQKGCVFIPHVALIRAGQKVVVKSSDPIQHNVHTFPNRNQGTNLLIKPSDQVGVELNYDRPETEPLQVKCDIHAWMASYHLVLDHPFMAVTDENGRFQVDGLPAGDYEFRVWHETGGLLEKGYQATVTGEDEPVKLEYKVDQFSL